MALLSSMASSHLHPMKVLAGIGEASVLVHHCIQIILETNTSETSFSTEAQLAGPDRHYMHCLWGLARPSPPRPHLGPCRCEASSSPAVSHL